MAWKWKLHIISIHAPTRGATPYGLLTANVRLFQSTLLQEERPVLVKRSHTIHQISIHAPTRGATAYVRKTGSGRDISIHAPTRGATITGAVLCLLNRYFNPRSYKRSDYMVRLEWTDKGNISIHAPTRGATGCTDCMDTGWIISIHAPTRGATERRTSRRSGRNYFNPRSYKRSDFASCSTLRLLYLFQSTLLQEERPLMPATSLLHF